MATPTAETAMASSEKPGPRALTLEESALYDRQIRLWGLAAQQRLSSARVLLAGLPSTPLGQELAKNLVLAGIATLGLSGISSTASAANGLLGADVATGLRAMNPLVKVVIEESLDPMEAAGRYDVICAVCSTPSETRSLASAARSANVSFFGGSAAGPAGWVFIDLGLSHKFSEGEGASAKNGELSFPSYAEAEAAQWGKEARRSECGWHVVQTLSQYAEHADGVMPSPNDVDRVMGIYRKLRIEKGAAKDNEKLVQRVAATAKVQLVPLAAIVGGVWGREVVKAISGRDRPLDNFFFFNADSCVGAVERVGPTH